MTQFIRSLIKSEKFEIRCPSFKPDGHRCSGEWDWKQCKKVGIFTQEERSEFEEGLSKNWIKAMAIICPDCDFSVYKG